jgi:hypothetical protein
MPKNMYASREFFRQTDVSRKYNPQNSSSDTLISELPTCKIHLHDRKTVNISMESVPFVFLTGQEL